MHQYAYHGKRNTINFSMQIECYKNGVNNKLSKANSGEQWILTYER